PTTTHAMISDPKLPFESATTGVEMHPEVPGDAAPASAAQSSAVPSGLPRTDEPVRAQSSQRTISTLQLWARRFGVLFFVFLCATVGVMLMIVPWRPEWSENPLLLSYPALHDLVASGFTRGLVTGLGLLNVWIGFWEALQYRED
ncbi:MAG: hypothetical protein WAK13_17545, partial [Terriglobales bacterium]